MVLPSCSNTSQARVEDLCLFIFSRDRIATQQVFVAESHFDQSGFTEITGFNNVEAPELVEWLGCKSILMAVKAE